MIWLIAVGKGVGITVPVSPTPGEKAGTWRTYNAQVLPEKAHVSFQGERWGEPVRIVLNGKAQDPASATLFGKSDDLKDYKGVNLLLKGSGIVKINLYYTYMGRYHLISKEIELSSDWKELSLNLDEGLEFGLGMPNRPDVVMPYKMVISSEGSAEVFFGGAYIRR